MTTMTPTGSTTRLGSTDERHGPTVRRRIPSSRVAVLELVARHDDAESSRSDRAVAVGALVVGALAAVAVAVGIG